MTNLQYADVCEILGNRRRRLRRDSSIAAQSYQRDDPCVCVCLLGSPGTSCHTEFASQATNCTSPDTGNMEVTPSLPPSIHQSVRSSLPPCVQECAGWGGVPVFLCVRVRVWVCRTHMTASAGPGAVRHGRAEGEVADAAAGRHPSEYPESTLRVPPV
jgi:hypothetical protein